MAQVYFSVRRGLPKAFVIYRHAALRQQIWQMYLIVAIILAVHLGPSLAKEFIVGGDKGWTVGVVDYQAWADGEEFHIGDKLVFNYPPGKHTVCKVDGVAFKSCTVPPANMTLTTGKDIVTLASTGKKWYICGVGQHCANGQKFSITVKPVLLATASPPMEGGAEGPSSSNGIMTHCYHVLTAAIVAMAMMVMA
ncbi:blue copper protein 1a-like [Tasmannia lanceolata]|uniref:blue copper protein 1a-like n=1 Tax=Tasmannia lanceolata TaxID=3420 RepID=UPI0040628884